MTDGTRRVVLPAAGSWFEGHFPGNPILPGVAHLALLERPLSSVISLRLRAPLAPGDVIEVEESPSGVEGRIRCSLLRGSVPASRALVEVAAPADAARVIEAVNGAAPEGDTAGDDPAGWIPHRPPILSVERLVRADDRGCLCRIRLPRTGAFAAGERVPAFFALECAAQATAVWEAAHRVRVGGPPGPRAGYLVGARDADFAAPWLVPGASGTVRVRLEAHAPPLAVYGFTVEVGNAEVASGTIQVWIPS